jgi:hypothetical protein
MKPQAGHGAFAAPGFGDVTDPFDAAGIGAAAAGEAAAGELSRAGDAVETAVVGVSVVSDGDGAVACSAARQLPRNKSSDSFMNPQVGQGSSRGWAPSIGPRR